MSGMFKEVKFKQPASFEFTKENFEAAKKIIAKYPATKQQSAVMPLLDLAQRQHDNWIPTAAMDYIATMLDMPFIKVYEVASFYTMYNKQPVGKNLIQVCRTTPCWLRGSDEVTQACKDRLGINVGETTEDNKFTIVEVECLGACVNAPMVQINDDYYEDLNAKSMTDIIDELAKGQRPKQGSQTGRQASAPVGWTRDTKPTTKASSKPASKPKVVKAPAKPKAAPKKKIIKK
jgi:NADH-quinone oxidoreductase E subunit